MRSKASCSWPGRWPVCWRSFSRLGFGAVVEAGQPVGDHAVVAGGVGKGLLGQVEAGTQLQGAAVGLHFGEDAGCSLRIGDDGDASVVLGRRRGPWRAADVDVLDGVFQGHAGLRDGGGEGVEVHAPPGRWSGCRAAAMVAMCSARSRRARMPPCTFGCRVLTRPSSISGKTRVVADVGHRPGRRPQHLGGAAGGQELDALGGEARANSRTPVCRRRKSALVGLSWRVTEVDIR